MDIQTFLGIGIVGVATSLVTEAITRLSGSKPLASKAIAILVALVFGSGYVFASHAAWFQSVLSILAVSSTVYALVFNRNQ
jgi:hypothetical protein